MAQASVFDVSNYFLFLDQQDDAADGISNLKMQKLAYYAYGFYAALHKGAQLFPEEFKAWTHGPVVPPLYRKYKQYGKSCLPFDPHTQLFDFTAETQDFIKDVYDEFGQYSAWRLRDMTHEEAPWLNHQKSENALISHQEIYEYFLTRVH